MVRIRSPDAFRECAISLSPTDRVIIRWSTDMGCHARQF